MTRNATTRIILLAAVSAVVIALLAGLWVSWRRERRRGYTPDLLLGVHDPDHARCMDAAERLGLPAELRWSLHLSAGYSQPRFRKSPLPASCRAEALARDADGNHPDEVLGFGLYPRLKANVADRRTLGLGIHVMRRAPH